MERSLKNTLAVLLATAMTAAAIFGGVQLADLASGGSSSSAALPSASALGSPGASAVAQSGATLTCPRTGCTASTCHATTGLPPGQ